MAISKEALANEKFWAIPSSKVIEILETSENGLDDEIVKERLEQFGKNIIPEDNKGTKLKIFLRQFTNPLIIILMAAGGVNLFLQDF